jgi:hypothetical protein
VPSKRRQGDAPELPDGSIWAGVERVLVASSGLGRLALELPAARVSSTFIRSVPVVTLTRVHEKGDFHALYLAAVTQVRHDTPGRVYYQRKIAEGKSKKEALRALKRRISDAVWRQLQVDLGRR